MRKFTKILTLILTLAAIVTAFTVVALAEDKADPISFTSPSFSTGQGVVNMGSFDNVDAPTTLASSLNNDGVNTGRISIEESYPGGNKYLYLDGMGTKGGGRPSIYVAFFDHNKAPKYTVGQYPIMTIDFDVMSPNGRYGSKPTDNPQNTASLSLRPYYAKSTGGYGAFGGTRIGTPEDIRFSELGLKNEAYLWQHVTVIIEYQGAGVYSTYVHIDGNAEPSFTLLNQDVSAPYIEQNSNPDLAAFYSTYITTSYWGQKAQVAIDNYTQTLFTQDYERSDALTYIYNKDYQMPESYKYTVATVTDTVGNTKYYDDMDKAVANLSDGYTLTVEKEDPKNALIINNAITLNTNGFNVSVESTSGYGITETVDGVHTIEKLPSSLVKWDACSDHDNCTCLGAHKLAAEYEVVIGAVPEYIYDIPELEFDGLVLTLLGWSYDNDGTVDEIGAITQNEVENGLTLYPVFSQKQYDFSLTKNGQVTYYTADQFKEIFAAAESIYNVPVTVTLLRDAEVYDQVAFSKAYIGSDGTQYRTDITFDLRGNTLTKVNLSGNKYKYNGSEYVADGTLSATGAYLFSSARAANDIIITSSTEEKGTLVCFAAKADVYYNESGKMERYEVASTSGASIISYYNASNRTLKFENVNIYSNAILDASGGSNRNVKFIVENCNYYMTSGTDDKMAMTVYLESGGKLEAIFKNSMFYFPQGISSGTKQFMRLADNSKNSDYTVLVDNCDFIGMTSVVFFQYYSSAPKMPQPNVLITNSRMYNTTGNGQKTYYLGEGAVYTSTSNNTVVAGYVSAPVSITEDYTVPVSRQITIDPQTKQPVFNTETTSILATYSHSVKKCSEVPESVTDARFSMLYYTNFNMVMYIPVADGMTDITLSGFTKADETVKIDGNEYYVFVKASTTTGVSDTVTAKLSYKVNGGVYRQTYNLSALVYADLMLNDPWMDVETKAIANMVRYIKEARLAAGLAAGAEFDELIALGELDALGAKEDYVDTTVDYSTLAGYVNEVKFMLDGTNAAYLITLTSSDIDVAVKFVDGEEIVLADSTTTENAKYTTGTRVYDIANKAIEITVTVPAADGGEPTVITGTYSVKAYINATDNALTKAMYEFGVAADAYRSFLTEDN